MATQFDHTGAAKITATLITLACTALGGAASAGVDYQAVAISGEPAADSPPGSVYSGYFGEHPSINHAGDVAFIAGVLDPSATQTTNALFGPSAGTGSPLGKLFEVGGPAPGFGDGSTINGFTRGVTINASGDVAFLARVQSVSLGQETQAMFGPSAGAGTPTGAIVTENDPSLGLAVTNRFIPRSGSQPTINDAGQIAFGGRLGLTGVEAVFGPSASSAGYVQLVSEQDTLPGVPFGRSYEQLVEVPTFLDTGEVAYEVMLSYRNASGSERFESRIFAASEQGTRLLGPPIELGASVPGRDDGAVFSGLTSQMSVNSAGDILFYRGFIEPGSGEGITGWFGPTDGPGSDVGLVLRTNIPRVFDGEEIVITGTGASSLNNNGDFAIIGLFDSDPLQDPPLSRPETALFVQIDGQPELIAKTGDWFDVDPGPSAEDLRQITRVSIATHSFNDAGQVLFQLEFEDGSSGLFVATVPEPGAGLVMSGLCLGALARRRSRR